MNLTLCRQPILPISTSIVYFNGSGASIELQRPPNHTKSMPNIQQKPSSNHGENRSLMIFLAINLHLVRGFLTAFDDTRAFFGIPSTKLRKGRGSGICLLPIRTCSSFARYRSDRQFDCRE
jgi:hypothetical protein